MKFDTILLRPWGCFGHQGVPLAIHMMVVPPVLSVQGLGCVVSKFGEDLSSGSKVIAVFVAGGHA